jgi:hypothetical protein
VNEILLVIGVLCNLNTTNVIMPKEEKISCIEHFTNCLVGPNGTYLSKERANCESKWKNIKQNNRKAE